MRKVNATALFYAIALSCILVSSLTLMDGSFLKLCKVKYYNFSPVHSIQKSFSFQTGDPLGPLSAESNGGTSIWGLLSSDPSKRTFPAFFHPKLKHIERGTVGMATVPHPSDPDIRLAASQFIVTLGDNTDYLNGKSAIFGRVVEGFDVLEKINNAIVDSNGYPLVDIRIKHTVVLDDPYPDPAGVKEPEASPRPTRAQLATIRLGDDEQKDLAADDDADEEKATQKDKTRREREARAQALTLEMMGDLPFAEVKPPENVLFVCKLNPITQDSDLELIFSRFGKILSCEVIRDPKTSDSLQYAFIEFEEKNACEDAYYKMQNVLIDDRRIHVDFSQSVSKLSDTWRKETNTKRQRHTKGRGGWGGVQELEKWRKYRSEDLDDGPYYEMVHGEDEIKPRYDQPVSGKRPKVTEDRGRDRHRHANSSGGRPKSDSRERNASRGRRDSMARHERKWDTKKTREADKQRQDRSRSPRSDRPHDYRRRRDDGRPEKHREQHYYR